MGVIFVDGSCWQMARLSSCVCVPRGGCGSHPFSSVVTAVAVVVVGDDQVL